jgi:hypothetical protein
MKFEGFLIICVFIFLTNLYADVELLITESSYELITNEDVTISIDISDIEEMKPMRSFELTISFDTSYLLANSTDFTEGEFLSDSADPTQFYVAGSNGNFTITCSILGVTSGVYGDGTLFTLALTNLNNDCTNSIVEITNVTLRDPLNNDITVDNITNCLISIDSSPAYANITVFLEGPYIANSGGFMNHALVDGGYLPTISPYDNEDIGSLPDVSPNYIVDWLQIELRTTPTGITEESFNAFLLDDGSVVSTNGGNGFELYFTNGNSYYFVVRHRNHLDIMSNSTYTFGNTSEQATDIDLTVLANVYGTNGVKQKETGIYAMWAGDADNDGRILSPDLSAWNSDFGIVPYGYHYTDINLNARVDAPDQAIWKLNFGVAPYAQVPAQN